MSNLPDQGVYVPATRCGWLRRPELDIEYKGFAWEKPDGEIYVAHCYDIIPYILTSDDERETDKKITEVLLEIKEKQNKKLSWFQKLNIFIKLNLIQ